MEISFACRALDRWPRSLALDVRRPRTRQTTEPPNLAAHREGAEVPVPGRHHRRPGKTASRVAQTKTQEMLFTISDIDVQDGTAEFLGTAGRSYVTAVLSGWSMYFVESSVGQLNVTTVFAQEASPKKLKAVHSRHGYLQMQVGPLHLRAVGVAELRRLRNRSVTPRSSTTCRRCTGRWPASASPASPWRCS